MIAGNRSQFRCVTELHFKAIPSSDPSLGREIVPKFALAYPYFIIMLCLVVAVVGVTTVVRMPVDLFPQINIPVVVVATFYAGMPPQQIEADITNTFERFFTLASNYRPHRIALADRRESDQGLFSAGNGCERGAEQHRQSGDGGFAALATGDAAAGGVEIRRIEPAGVPGHLEGARV